MQYRCMNVLVKWFVRLQLSLPKEVSFLQNDAESLKRQGHWFGSSNTVSCCTSSLEVQHVKDPLLYIVAKRRGCCEQWVSFYPDTRQILLPFLLKKEKQTFTLGVLAFFCVQRHTYIPRGTWMFKNKVSIWMLLATKAPLRATFFSEWYATNLYA